MVSPPRRAPHAAGYGTAGPEFVRRLIDRDLDLAVTEGRRMIGTFVAKFVAAGASEQIARAAKNSPSSASPANWRRA